MIKSIKRITAAVLFVSITVSSMFFMTSCKKKGTSSKNRIVVFNYGDYIDQTLLDKFEIGILFQDSMRFPAQSTGILKPPFTQ